MSRAAQIDEAILKICDHLQERTATLFLGAGINYGILDSVGNPFPLARGLSDLIAKDLLDSPDLNLPMDDTCEIAIGKTGREKVNNYIFQCFNQFEPGPAHLSLVQLPWESIYSTNYDTMVEKASRNTSIAAAGTIRPVFSDQAHLEEFTESDILYYKLHGSIDDSNTSEGRLILTKEDYRYYEECRVRLFNRLKNDLVRRCIVFIGYSMADSNMRGLLEDCRRQLEIVNLPLSYAVRPNFKEVEETHWREHYNIQLLDIDGGEFLRRLKQCWFAQDRVIEPFELRRSKRYGFVDENTTFEKIGESYYLISPSSVTGQSNAQRFFRGGEASWADVRDGVPPDRDLYWTIYEAVFSEMVQPNVASSMYLVTGSACTGKTSLLRKLAFSIAQDFNNKVLMHIPGTPLDSKIIGSLVNESDPQRIVVIIPHAGECVKYLDNFREDLRQKKLPVTTLLEERLNQWKVASSNFRGRGAIESFELGSLSEEEIERIIDSLTAHDALGRLSGLTKDHQISHFIELAETDLLVALRELTTGTRFHEIIKDEYEKIPSQTAKLAYVYVAALGRIELPVRYEMLQHILQIDYSDLKFLVFEPAEGVLLDCEARGNSRHNSSFGLTTRHPVISQIIFESAAPDDAAKFEILNTVLTHLDPGYLEDRRVLEEIVRRRELVNAFESPDIRRAIYDRLAVILPRNPYVLQHRSILERELDDAQRSEKYARAAVAIDPNNFSLKNTLGLALEFSARRAHDATKRAVLLSEATRLFDSALQINNRDPYSYLGKYYVLRQETERENNVEKRNALRAQLISLLEEAHEITDESPVISVALAKERDELGDALEAESILASASKSNSTNTRIRDALIRVMLDSNKGQEAFDLAVDGTKLDPSSWRMERYVARIGRRLNKPVGFVQAHYDAAVRLNKGDIGIVVEQGAFLFMNGKIAEAKECFLKAKAMPVVQAQKAKVREWWLIDDLSSKRRFTGKVQKISAPGAVAISVPENIEAFFFLNRPFLAGLREGDPIRFLIGFNAFGPRAEVVRN